MGITIGVQRRRITRWIIAGLLAAGLAAASASGSENHHVGHTMGWGYPPHTVPVLDGG